MSGEECPFCRLDDTEAFHVGSQVRAIWDKYPVSVGHALIITRRHVPGWFEASQEERSALMAAVDLVRAHIDELHGPAGYNIGMNVGASAGQTVPHVHVHIIPRYPGDVRDPTGGIRGVVPGKANYLRQARHSPSPHQESLVRGGSDDPMLPHLVAHLAAAKHVDIAVAFAMTSGVGLLAPHLVDVAARGGRIRILAGDYLCLTEPEALRRLLDVGPSLELRVYESGNTSFHLKSYICIDDNESGAAFVGSSNLSKAAFTTGVEWNYRVVTASDAEGLRTVRHAFEELFHHPKSVVVTPDWIARYEARRVPPAKPPEGAVAPEPPRVIPRPHQVQQEALNALAATRAAGNGAGLVVLATGLGKTWLAAFDTEQAAARRVLFVAHRDEILDQALDTFRTIRPNANLGKYTGTERTETADVTFASIQTLGRRTHLDRFAPDHFDYIVVDEFHHASATTYRRLLDHFTPSFLLGLTATPERTDGADLLALCGENLVYRCDLIEGIRRHLLSPFDYYGVPDEVDYEQIPWRSARFDEESLTTAVATTSRAANALEQLQRRGGKRTIAFCVSKRHADFMRASFADVGLRVAAVHSGETSDPRTLSLEKLQAGELDVVFAVDMFNEGVDVPAVDTVLMLRPTESPVLWLQQFGRGLRWQEGKRLKVIDYIGNHRTFLLKPRTLFQLEEGDAQLSYALKLLDEGRIDLLLPPGCSVTYDLEAKEILRALIRPEREGLREFYLEFRERTGGRPTATEVFHGLFDPKGTRKSHGSWFQFVRAMGDLDPAADRAEVRLRDFLTTLEVTPMTKSFKMLVLLAMIAEEAFPGTITIEALASRVRTLAKRSGSLRADFGDVLDDDAALVSLLEENPIAAWTAGRGTGGQQYFHYADGRFSTSLPAVEDSAAAVALVRELVEWRLAVYLRRSGLGGSADRFVCRVSHTNGRPILFLPSRDRTAGLPQGWVDVVADGESYQAKFVQIAINVMQKGEDDENVLPDILRGWFGAGAGNPGTAQTVEFVRSGGGYVMAPHQGEIPDGPKPWASYARAEIPKLFGFDFRGFESQSGVVERDNVTLLFVTLDKASKPEEHRYKDEFLSPTVFRWQSQNRTARSSNSGRRLKEHQELGIGIHLFVRLAAKVRGKTSPFVYAGVLKFKGWEGDKPITVTWGLDSPVPPTLRAKLKVPASSDLG